MPMQNGLLTAIVTDEEAAEIMAALERTPELPVTVDLEEQTIVCGNRTYNSPSIRCAACGCSTAGTTSR